VEPDTIIAFRSFFAPSEEERRTQTLDDLSYWQRELGLMAKLKESDPEQGKIYWNAQILYLNALAEIGRIREEMAEWR